MSGESTALKLKSFPHRTTNEQYSLDDGTTWVTMSIEENQEESNDKKDEIKSQTVTTTVEISVQDTTPTTPPTTSFSPTTIITTSSSVDTLNGETVNLNLLSGPSSPSNLSSITLVGSTGSGTTPNEIDKDEAPDREFKYSQAPTSPLPERKRHPAGKEGDQIESEPKSRTLTIRKSSEHDDGNKQAKTISSKPKIVSAVAKHIMKDDSCRSSSAHSTPSKISSNVLKPMSYFTMNRRPSAGTIGAIDVPVAALNQHRLSLQLNSSDGGFGIPKVKFDKIITRLLSIILQINMQMF